jgi:carnitine O-acetyltransferase
MHTTSEVPEDSKKGTALYQHQDKLPHLPIPSIASTAAKYLESARPFVSDVAPEAMVASDEHPTKDYERLKKAVKEFETSDFVKELQGRLEKHAEGKDSWIIDWFNSANYFGA